MFVTISMVSIHPYMSGPHLPIVPTPQLHSPLVAINPFSVSMSIFLFCLLLGFFCCCCCFRFVLDSTYEWNHAACLSPSYLFIIISSRSIYVVKNGISWFLIYSFFNWRIIALQNLVGFHRGCFFNGWITLHCIYTLHPLHPSADT